MIHGIGTDIVAIARMEASLARFGDKFVRRILASQELQAFADCARQASFLAKRFAAKEAAVKAMGTGFRDGISLNQIAVSNDNLGKPILSFSGRALDVCDYLGVGEAHLSLSDEKDYAIAFVTLMRCKKASENVEK